MFVFFFTSGNNHPDPEVYYVLEFRSQKWYTAVINIENTFRL